MSCCSLLPAARAGAAAVLLGASLLLPATAADGLLLHVPSPDWRDQILYFVLTDRFDDGDPANNDQGAGEFKAGSKPHFNGGDLAGLTRRLDYIRGLGVTGVWVTPPVLNQWWDAQVNYGGYHGYWASDFTRVDPHLGTLDDYRRLSDALHRRGMTLVQDIVVNHTGNFFGYREGWDARDPAAGWTPNPGARPSPRPVQPPFDRNDPRDPAQRAEAVYHWTPDVKDFGVAAQVMNWQMSGLDDLNTENPVVRRALRASYGHWITEVGVDAFRVDTAFYVPPDYFDDFLFARDPQAPGIDLVARRTGRTGFLTFGEGFALDKPFQTTAARRIERYATGPGGRPRLGGMLNFPLYGSLNDVLARGAPAAELGHRIAATMREHRDPHRMPSFVDNHDVDRFLAGGSEAALRHALLALMTLPGIPVLYYGTEQGFIAQRAAMFAAGYESGGRDRFDTEAPLYRYIQGLTVLRKGHPTLSRGRPAVLRADAAGPGVLAWRMDPEPGSASDALLVLLNTADRPALADRLPTGVRGARPLAGVYAIDGAAPAVRTATDGTLTLEMPARSGLVLRLPPAVGGAAPAGPIARAPSALQLDPPRATADGTELKVQGRAAPGRSLKLVLDGDLRGAPTVTADGRGRWQGRLDTRRMVDPRTVHRVVAWDPASGEASAARSLKLQRRWTLRAEQPDPAGDDHGRPMDGRRLAYPTDPGWGANRQMDLRGLRVLGSGDALKIEIDTHRLSQGWNPPNGFDRVAFTVFIGDPARPGGASVMPQQDGELPTGLRWHWRLRVHGWSNALFSAEGASATHEGTPLSPGASVQVDRARHRVTFTLPGGLLGPLPGLQVYVTTWDYDGGYRALTPEPGSHTPGGAPGPKVMDDLGPVRLN
jgi:glycosidase